MKYPLRNVHFIECHEVLKGNKDSLYVVMVKTFPEYIVK